MIVSCRSLPWEQALFSSELTCNIASLCISPSQAGIMLLRTANSSFIFDLRRLSIRLCAVFLAILRPATLVADGCFFLDKTASLAAGAATVVAIVAPADATFLLEPVDALPAPAPADLTGLLDSCVRGFIWMIFRDRVGGGGKANESL